METRIKELREKHKLKQTQLAQLTGIDQRTISNYETGKTYPDAKALVAFADCFKVSVDYILYRTGDAELSKEETDERIDGIISQLLQLKSNRK